MKKNKKSQAAMEFLMTYGWAILVVLIAIGALAYFGVLNPTKNLPEVCTLSPGLGCNDFAVYKDGIIIKVQNGLGQETTNFVINSEVCGDFILGENYVNRLPDGKEDTYTAICDLNDNSKIKDKITITYNKGTTLEHRSEGQIVSKVQNKVGAMEKICSKAANASPNQCGNLGALFTPGIFSGEANWEETCHNNYPGTC